MVMASNSFTGSHYIEYLLKHTEAEIVGISRSPEYPGVMLPYLYGKDARPERFTFHQLDVNTRIEEVHRLCEEFQPEVVVNYAAQGEVRNSWKWPEQWYETNCLGVVKLTQGLVEKPWLKRYVSVSTPEVYGSTGLDVKESHHYEPSTPYAASKLAGDLHVLALQKRFGFPCVLTRAANLYGIHQQLYRIIPRTIIYVTMGRKIQLHGRGKAERAFIHARDVADATHRAITDGTDGEVYHVAPDKGLIEIGELVRMICEMMDKSFEDATEMMDENFGQDARFSMDASKARAELGWEPKVSLENGIEEMIKWISDNWNEISQLPLDYIHKK